MFGGKGNDTITGGAGSDLLDGGEGDDTLKGVGGFNYYDFDLPGFGHDTIIGSQKSNDILIFSNVSASNSDGTIDLTDLTAAIASVTDGGLGHDVTVDFKDGSSILFKGAGTGQVHAITDLVANSPQVAVQ